MGVFIFSVLQVNSVIRIKIKMSKFDLSVFKNISLPNWIILLVFVFSVYWNLSNTTSDLGKPLLDRHLFRQTQTALTTYWMVEEGIKIAYETPLFGPPWTIPFEFPTYQLIVASIVKVFDVPLDQTGRLVSLSFFYLTLIPLYFVIRSFSCPKRDWLIVSSLLLTSPFYIFWSRTFMIESTAVFLGATSSAVFYYILKIEKIKNRYISIASIVCCLAALTKITTFCVFLGFNFLGLAYFLIPTNGSRVLSSRKVLKIGIATFLLPVVVAMVWTKYTDVLKSNSPTPMAEMTLSSNLNVFAFGTIEQRFSPERWLRMETHGIDYLLSAPIPILIVLIVFLLLKKGNVVRTLSLLAFASGPMVFFNLYYQHDYYWYANGVFAFLFIGCTISCVTSNEALNRYCACLLLLVYSGFQVITYNHSVYSNSGYAKRIIDVAEDIKSLSNPDDSIMIYGYDWNSAIAYYSERKSIMPMNKSWLLSNGTQQAVRNLGEGHSRLQLLVVWKPKEDEQLVIETATDLFGFDSIPVLERASWTIYRKMDEFR